MKGNPDFCRKVSTLAIDALARAKMRGILLGGWAGLTAQVLDTSTATGAELASYAAANILELQSCPHDWLFPRCAAVCHHGGAGTTSAGLRAGRPTVICAMFGDQPWHGSLVAKKKLGLYAGAIGKVTSEVLGSLLTQVVADEQIAKNVAEMSELLKSEDGTLKTHEAIERAVASFPYPWPARRSNDLP